MEPQRPPIKRPHSFVEHAPGQVLNYLKSKGWEIKTHGPEINCKICPWCPDTKGKKDNLWKLYVHQEQGTYFCQRCHAKGTLYQLKEALGDAPAITGTSGRKKRVYPDQAATQTYDKNLMNADPEILVKLLSRGLTWDTINYYRVGWTMGMFSNDSDEAGWEPSYTFPWIVKNHRDDHFITRVKLRSFVNKSHMQLVPPGGEWGWFGYHTIPDQCKDVVITEGEWDAMSVWQDTGIPAISLPNGAASLPDELLPQLARFERIYLWMDNDAAGLASIEAFSEKLGTTRTLIVTTPAGNDKTTGLPLKDANDCLKNGIPLKPAIGSAKPIIHKDISNFDAGMRAGVLSIMERPGQLGGLASSSLPSLTKMTNGHRLGDLTIVTGPTGRGKTSITCQMSLDYAGQGMPTLWGSFEIPNISLAQKMLCQLSQKPLGAHMDEFDYWADRLAAMPMYFMKFFGSTAVEDVLDVAEHAVLTLGIEHVILDNLQFMTSGQTSRADELSLQDDAVRKIRAFASNHKVHATVIVHPRKQESIEKPLGINDILGSGKITQEADFVHIVQVYGNRTCYEVVKNRRTGKLGKVYFSYNDQSLRIHEIDEIQSLNASVEPTRMFKKVKQGQIGAMVAARSEVKGDATDL